MKKKTIVAIAVLMTLFGFALSINNSDVQAAAWGAKKVFTTPKRTRGTWYYRQGRKIEKVRITAHTLNGRKLYHVLPDAEYDRLGDEIAAMPRKKLRATYNWLDRHQLQAYSMKWHHIAGFNVNSWLAGAGDGDYYVPTTRKVNGRKVKVLRVGTGYDNMFSFYVYKTRKLAR